ncbi:MAG: TonB-dependent receptor [Sphingomonas bacterium]|uniref:TonB-dependent receptor plug domain-containing protein n=1 Tax=Sphingomonas bacterium TaxID=1895847 RepID=UPI0026240A0A|nr:TonB-dependent receptor [Sphingomonas bacterium]MDB5704562.1 TonB-dependent receptor [Sphingomonas bacterium]
MSINSTINRGRAAILPTGAGGHSGILRKRAALVAATAALFAAASAHAQEAVPAVAEDCAVEPNDCIVIADQRIAPDIIVAAGVPQYRNQIGQSVTILRRDEIERRQTVSIADLLATTPGVTVSRNGGVGTLSAVRIRGAEGDQTLTVIDGVRVNDPSSPGGGFDFGNLLAGSIDRIEVLRGPNSVPWGSQAIGGVVNIVTATPTEGLQGRASAEYGSHNSLFTTAGLSGGSGAVTAAVTGGYLRTDGISAAASGTEPDGYRQYGGTGRVDVEFAPGIGLDLRGYYANSHVALDGFASTPPYGPADGPQYADTQEIYGYAGLHADILEGRFRNRVGFTIADINRDNFDPFFPSSARGRSERYEYQGDFQVVDQVRLVAGAEHEDSRFVSDADHHGSGTTSFYGEAIVRPIDQLTVTGGVRNDDNRDYGSHTTFGANAALALDTGTTIRASYAEGFKAPTLYQRFASFYGTKNLRPESSRGYDVGVEQRFLNGHAKAGVTWFHRDTRDQIDFDSKTFTYFNVNRARAEGVEFELELRPIDDLTFTGNYSYIDSKNRTPGPNFGKDLARRPKQTVSVSADYRLPFGLSVGGTISHVGDSYDDAGNFTRLDGYVLAGLRAEMPIGDHFALYGRVENLFDEKYQTVAGYGTDGRAVYGGIRVKLN